MHVIKQQINMNSNKNDDNLQHTNVWPLFADGLALSGWSTANDLFIYN